MSPSLLILAPDQLTADKIRKNTRPMTVDKIICDYPTSEAENVAQTRPHTQMEVVILAKSSQDPVIDVNQPKSEEKPANEEEPVTDKIVSHRINPSRNHKYAKFGENRYCVRWYWYMSSADTWEPISYISRSQIINYYNFQKRPIPADIDNAVDG